MSTDNTTNITTISEVQDPLFGNPNYRNDIDTHSISFFDRDNDEDDDDEAKRNAPNLYEEADEMLQLSLLIYSITPLRTLAKRRNAEQKRRKNRKRRRRKKVVKSQPQPECSDLELSSSPSSSPLLSQYLFTNPEVIETNDDCIELELPSLQSWNPVSSEASVTEPLSTSSSSGESSSIASSLAPSSVLSSVQSSSLEQVLSLPLSLETCFNMIEENFECIAQEIGDEDQEMASSVLRTIQQRYELKKHRRQQRRFQRQNSTRKFSRWWSTRGSGSFLSEDGEDETVDNSSAGFVAPSFVAYGDDNPSKDLVYGITIDPLRKRITVVFRGSVTLSDFRAVALIALNRRPNPVSIRNARKSRFQSRDESNTVTDNQQNNLIGLHQGFYDFLFKSPSPPSYSTTLSPRSKKKNNKTYQAVNEDDANDKNDSFGGNNGKDKYTEILEILIGLFEKHKGYKLYFTGHSLGGALATLFSFYVAAAIDSAQTSGKNTEFPGISIIPTPISCVSIASPRVGDRHFQHAFQCLEERKVLQHLRIVNDGDLIPVVPKSAGTKIWKSFDENETYHHTGIKLKLYRTVLPYSSGNTATSDSSLWSFKYDYKIQYFDANRKSLIQHSAKRSSDRSNNPPPSQNKVISSLKREEVPYFVDHFGYTYCEIINQVKDGLSRKTLNELYKNNKMVDEPSEQSSVMQFATQ